jgi:glycosyltransferase involved in cell wall biosynthesis
MSSTPEGITVVTLSRGRPQLLRRAIASVRAQDYPGPVEHLVVADDDPAAVAVAGLAPPRPGREVTAMSVRRPADEQGPAASGRASVYPRLARLLNVGIRAARRSWIAFLDDDNEFEPDHLSSLAACAAEQEVIAVHSGRQMTWPDGSPYLERIFPGAPDPAEGARIYRLMCERGGWVEGTNVLLDRVDAGQHGFRNSTVLSSDDPVFLVDQNLWLIRAEVLRRIPVPEQFTAAEIARNTCPDDKLLEALVRNGTTIASTRRPTVRYYIGGISNGDEQERPQAGTGNGALL